MRLYLILFILSAFMSACTINSHIMLKTNKDYEFDKLLDLDNPEYKLSINDLNLRTIRIEHGIFYISILFFIEHIGSYLRTL